MGMSIEDNKIVVAKTISQESKEVFPLAIKIKEFNVRHLTKMEVEIALEGLKREGVITSYRHGWGLVIQHSKEKRLTFERTGDEPIYDRGSGLEDDEVFEIKFDAKKLKNYLDTVKDSHDSEQRMVQKRGKDFIIDDRKIPFDTYNSIHYNILDILYGDDGSEKRMSYQDLFKILKKPPYNLTKVDNQMVRNAINNGLYRQAGDEIKNYVSIEPNSGLVFKNPVKT